MHSCGKSARVKRDTRIQVATAQANGRDSTPLRYPFRTLGVRFAEFFWAKNEYDSTLMDLNIFFFFNISFLLLRAFKSRIFELASTGPTRLPNNRLLPITYYVGNKVCARGNRFPYIVAGPFYCYLYSSLFLVLYFPNVDFEQSFTKSEFSLLLADGVEWFHNDVKVDPRQHGRIRYSKKKYVKQGIAFDERRFSSKLPLDLYRNSIAIDPRASDWWTRHQKWLLGDDCQSGLLLPKNCKATRPMTITITRSTLRLFTPRKRKAISQWPKTEKTCPVRTRHPLMTPLGLRRLSATVTYKCPADGIYLFLFFFLWNVYLEFYANFTIDLWAATGYPKPEIVWTKDGGPIKRHLGSAKMQKWSLELEEATTYDSGNCTCTVSNSHGSVSFTFEVLIQGIASIKTRFSFIALYTQRWGIGRWGGA